MKKIIILLTIFMSLTLTAQFPSPESPAPPQASPLSPTAKTATKSVKAEALSFEVPETWNKKPNQNLWTNGKGDSINIISEAAPGYSLKSYVDLSIKNMKKMIKTYKIISNGDGKARNVDYIWYLGNYSLKEVGAPSGTINIYSLFIDAGNTKYVVTIGGLPENFKVMEPVFKNIMKSISLNKNYKKVIDDKGGIRVINKMFSINVPKGWVKKDGTNMWTDPATRSSVNAIFENAAGYDLNKYMELSLENMKKMIPSYKLTERKTKKVNGETIGILIGEFQMNNTDIKLYSVVMDSNGMKYVLSIGGPKKYFNSMDKTFNQIINSFKKLK